LITLYQINDNHDFNHIIGDLFIYNIELFSFSYQQINIGFSIKDATWISSDKPYYLLLNIFDRYTNLGSYQINCNRNINQFMSPFHAQDIDGNLLLINTYSPGRFRLSLHQPEIQNLGKYEEFDKIPLILTKMGI